MPPQHVYRSIRTGTETMPAGLVLPRHRHREGYANVVLAGAFVEASFAGRFTVAPGDVLLHGAFDCHANAPMGTRGPRILRLPWLDDGREGLHRVADPDRLVRLAERDPRAATDELRGMLQPVLPREVHWTDALASAMRADPSTPLAAWSESCGLAPETVSRGFARRYGTTPKQFRAEVRARLAWRRIVAGATPLTALAYELGFADSAHLSRSVRLFTGRTPSAWRSLGQLRSSGESAALLAHVHTILEQRHDLDVSTGVRPPRGGHGGGRRLGATTPRDDTRDMDRATRPLPGGGGVG